MGKCSGIVDRNNAAETRISVLGELISGKYDESIVVSPQNKSLIHRRKQLVKISRNKMIKIIVKIHKK
jgi:hypothetical protein